MSPDRAQRGAPAEYTDKWPFGSWGAGDPSAGDHYVARRAARQLAELVRIVQQRRGEWGWSQEDLAREAGTTQKTISELEAGRVWPDLGTLLKTLEALDLEMRVGPRPASGQAPS